MLYDREIEINQRINAKDIQLNRLKSSLQYAYDNFAIHRQQFDDLGYMPNDINSFEDLKNTVYDKG